MKQLTPWTAMWQKPQSAERSVLLDYISPISIVSLFRSVKHRDFGVFIAVSGSLFLKAVTVLSTGLFVTANIPITFENAPGALQDKFVSSDLTYYNRDTIFGTNEEKRSAFIVYGVHNFNLSYPLGTTKDYAYQIFNTSQGNF